MSLEPKLKASSRNMATDLKDKHKKDTPKLFELRDEMFEHNVKISDNDRKAILPFPPLRSSDFEETGMVNLATLHFLMNTASLIAINKHEETTNKNFLEFNKMIDGRFIFLVSSHTAIDPKVYTLRNHLPQPDFEIDVALRHIGKSSINMVDRLICSKTRHVYFERIGQFVIIDPKERRSNTIPDWWSQKYNKFTTAQKQAPRMKNLIAPGHAFKIEINVPLDHIDINQHTTASAYLVYVTEAACEATQAGFFTKIKNDFRLYRIYTLEVSYHGESKVGDLLHIRVWENEDNKFLVHFIVKKNGDEKILQCTMSVGDVVHGLNPLKSQL